MSDTELFKVVLNHWRMVHNLPLKDIKGLEKLVVFRNSKLVAIHLPPMFSEIPEEIAEFKHLESLSLSGLSSTNNFLDTLEKLDSLRNLTIRRSLVDIVDESFNLKQLTSLSCNFSNLDMFPQSIASSLHKLVLAGNNIHRIPDVGTAFPELRSLDLSFNPLKEIGESILSFPKLIDLSVWSTEVVSVTPKAYGKLIKFDISYTPYSQGDLSDINFRTTKVIFKPSDRFRQN